MESRIREKYPTEMNYDKYHTYVGSYKPELTRLTERMGVWQGSREDFLACIDDLIGQWKK